MGLREDIEKTKHDISIFNFYANPVPKPPLLDYQSRVMDAAEKWAAMCWFSSTPKDYREFVLEQGDGEFNEDSILAAYRASQERKSIDDCTPEEWDEASRRVMKKMREEKT